MLDRAEAGLDEVRGGLGAHHTAVPVALQEQGGRLLVQLREGGRGIETVTLLSADTLPHARTCIHAHTHAYTHTRMHTCTHMHTHIEGYGHYNFVVVQFVTLFSN